MKKVFQSVVKRVAVIGLALIVTGLILVIWRYWRTIADFFNHWYLYYQDSMGETERSLLSGTL